MEEMLTTSVFDEIETEQIEYATQGQRFVNFLVDLAIAYGFGALMGGIVGIVIALTTRSAEAVNAFATNILLTSLVGVVSNIIIYTLIEGATKGRSLGKVLTRTQVVREDLSPITWKDAAIRSLSRMVPFEPFSALGGTPWHDNWSKTIVIKKKQKFV